ncbi:MAG: hypothetical protein HON98_09180 [Chloroflexi bacterium]|nr:hypothetical protein [Chloroflexota bacterium]MBT3668958.1 hypothetical protein [Chloroflexota bacterium]MBT4533308.1 hypothetical protein [Chloroflexota bacterium]MBT4683636.1 hypothetical protein [Chloroflexota bacterium]MBT4755843.1 hypothetical protein [Chloroflexota bacterium]
MASPWITNVFLQLIEYGYNSNGEGLLGKLFKNITTFGSLSGYLATGRILIIKAYRLISFSIPIVLILIFLHAKKQELFDKRIDFLMLFAAGIWGFAVSTRVLSIAAGGIVGLYALLKQGKFVVFPLFIYTLIASLISSITWPLIWIYGIKGYTDALLLNSDFPWFSKVLFDGNLYNSTELPASYLPKLMMLQFTEPFVILVLTGFATSIYLLLKGKVEKVKLILIYAWFFIPVLYIIFGHPPIYSNFRPLFFIIPPLFIVAGFALEKISSKVNNNFLILPLVLILCVPGLNSITQIHPYEYFYYNSFTGGVEGAHGLYTLDYWTISYKGAMEFVNENISPGSKIMVWKDNLAGKYYSENAFYFKAHTEVLEKDYSKYDYMIIPTRYKNNDPYFSELPIVFSVDVDNISLMLVLKIP